MKNTTAPRFSSFFLILMILFVNFAHSKNSNFQEIKTLQTPFEWWEQERLKRQKSVDQYVKKNKESYDWFQSFSVGNAGVPTIMFKAFPIVFPDIWGKEWVDEVGLWKRPKSEKLNYPHGVTWGKVFEPIFKVPVLSKLRIMVVNLTCASCHSGRVIGRKGKPQVLIGAPNTTFDPNIWQKKFFQVIQDKRYNAKNFRKAVKK
ncbi:MAG: hypothetical protein VXW15_13140, partial [Bdellovibrionota bacterium]|nr:hypothetical protein [Bdellovibrionota bacterium]